MAHNSALYNYGPLGEGGMGEVYKARDTHLNRIVAIKVLPAYFSNNAQMKARFELEARAIACLNHPHICVLYDVGHQDGIDFLVMEYIHGSTPITQRRDNHARSRVLGGTRSLRTT